MLNLRLVFIAVLPLLALYIFRRTLSVTEPLIDSSTMAARMAPLVIPAAVNHSATVIFVHGLGDTGHGWADAVELWQRSKRLDNVKFVLPHAPQIPISMNAGMSMPGWFDIRNIGDLSSPTAATDEDEAGVLNSKTYLLGLIQAEIDAGIPSERILLGGFSQGGAMSLFTGLTAPYKLGGIIGLSSWLLLNQKFASFIPEGSPNKATKIFMGHGSADPLVRYPLGKASEDTLKGLGFDVLFHTYPGMQHSACLEEFKDVENFIHARLN